jgi:Ribulose-5-phosphate 4-epimerase and related epimerases and aldolases
MDMYGAEARRNVVAVTQRMYETRLVNAYEGNVSIRVGDRVFITPGGINKGILTEDMVCEVDLDGNMLKPSGGYKPSSEAKMHYAIYKQRPKARSVVHNHSTFATAYAVARKPIVTKSVPEMIVLFGEIPVFKYGTPGTPEVYADLDKYSEDTDAFLIANHGLVAFGGEDIWATYEKVVAIEKTAKILIMSRLLGGEHQIEDDKLAVLNEMREDFIKNK